MRRISLVAVCCSVPSRISRACAAIVFFSSATESPEDEERRFIVDFFEAFLFIRAKQKARLANPVRAYATHIQGATVIDQSANSIGNRLMFSLLEAPPSRSVEGYASGTDRKVSVASA